MIRWLCALALTLGGGNPFLGLPLPAQPAALPTPGFHHLHLNSTNPEAAIEFYTQQFPTTAKATFAGPPATQPQTAFWHFGWHVTDMHKSIQSFVERGATASSVAPTPPGRRSSTPTRGHLMDHIALSVTDLDAWVAKMRAGGVTFLQQPYTVGEHRAVMIEGPSREAIELIEISKSPNP